MSDRPVGRPTRESSKAGFEAEVLRLYRAGRPIGRNESDSGTICGIMKAGKSTIFEVIKRAATSPSTALAIKEERQYHKETNDEFMGELAIKDWIEDMKLRRVKDWKDIVYAVRSMCEELQIYPEQLAPLILEDGKKDFKYAKKWLALKADVPLDKLRGTKIAYRAFAKKYGATDYELTLAGFDAKHYGVGKWKHVQLSDEQAKKIEEVLADESRIKEPGREEALFAFKFGLETCRPLEPIWNLTASQFHTLEYEISSEERRRIELIKKLSDALPPGMGDLLAELLRVRPSDLVAEIGTGKKTLYAVNVFRRKTEKSGAPYKTAYVSKGTFQLSQKLGEKNGGRIMNGYDPDEIYPFLKEAYAIAGAHAMDPQNPSRDYFQTHPIHSLRHCGAQRLLQKTGYNRAVTAELGGWEAEKTLEDHYGGVPVDIVRGVAGSLL